MTAFGEPAMFDAAFKALQQMFTPPFRSVLIKSILLAHRHDHRARRRPLQGRWTGSHVSGGHWAEGALGAGAHDPLSWVIWFASIAAALGIVIGGVFLMPAVTAFVGSFFVDEIAEIVEREYYPADAPGKALPLMRVGDRRLQDRADLDLRLSRSAAVHPVRRRRLVSSCSSPRAYLLSREYFELAAMRFRPVAEAKAFRKANQSDRFHRGPVHRGLRVDPDRQSRDAAVRRWR